MDERRNETRADERLTTTHEGLDDRTLLETVARATQLREGPEGVRAVIRAVGAERERTTREVAAAVRLPLPVVAAIRGELTARGVVERTKHGFALTVWGRALAARLFGSGAEEAAAPKTVPAGHEESFLRRVERIAPLRPDADVTLDQAKATGRTLVRRVEYLHRNDGVAGRKVLCLGDDDFVSAALVEWGRLRDEQGGESEPARLVVADVDDRILDTLTNPPWSIETVTYDARDPLPESLRGAFDVVITDPPYTLSGAELFLSRAVDATGAQPGAHCFFSFGHLDPTAMRSVQSALAEMGWVVTEWLPGFNEYEGSSVLAGVSLMAHLVLAEGATPVIAGRYDGPLYTADVRPTIRTYRCRGCNAEWEVGPTTNWQTVSHLKRQGCPLCGGDRFDRTGQRAATAPQS